MERDHGELHSITFPVLGFGVIILDANCLTHYNNVRVFFSSDLGEIYSGRTSKLYYILTLRLAVSLSVPGIAKVIASASFRGYCVRNSAGN